MIILTPNAKYKFEGRDNDGDDEAVVKESWVEDVYQLHEGLLDDNGIFLDIGANIGSVSVLVAGWQEERKDNKDKPNIRVIAYEPEPNNLELLRHNIKLNKLEELITVIPKAVHSSQTRLKIAINSGGSKILDSKDHWEGDVADVEAIRLEDVFVENNISYCDIMKMDIEGSEVAAIGQTNTDILAKIRHIRMEYHSMSQVDFGMIVSKLSLTHNIHFVGSYITGGNLYADRY